MKSLMKIGGFVLSVGLLSYLVTAILYALVAQALIEDKATSFPALGLSIEYGSVAVVHTDFHFFAITVVGFFILIAFVFLNGMGYFKDSFWNN